MLKRRLRLVALVTMIALGIAFAVEAGGKRSRRFTAPAAVGSDVPSLESDIVICPQFIAMNYGSYCLWYAIECVDGVVTGPVGLNGPCDLSPQTPCNCNPAVTIPGSNQAVAIGVDGFAGDLRRPIPVPDKVSAKVALSANESGNVELLHTLHKDVVAKAQIPTASGQTEEIYLQLISLTTRPTHPLDSRIAHRDRMGTMVIHAGSQILPQEKVEAEIDAAHVKLMPGRTKVAIVNFQGDDYCVMLNKP